MEDYLYFFTEMEDSIFRMLKFNIRQLKKWRKTKREADLNFCQKEVYLNFPQLVL